MVARKWASVRARSILRLVKPSVRLWWIRFGRQDEALMTEWEAFFGSLGMIEDHTGQQVQACSHQLSKEQAVGIEFNLQSIHRRWLWEFQQGCSESRKKWGSPRMPLERCLAPRYLTYLLTVILTSKRCSQESLRREKGAFADVEGDTVFSCPWSDAGKSALDPGLDFGKGSQKQRDCSRPWKQVCLEDRNVLNEKLEEENAEKGSLG